MIRRANDSSPRSAPPLPMIAMPHADEVDHCRSAALGFMAGATSWDKRKLAHWLQIIYRPLVGGMWSSPYKLTPAYGMGKVAAATRVERRALDGVVANAHEDVLGVLREIVSRPSIEMGRKLIAANLVTRAIDGDGIFGWAPLAQARMPLSARVMSLFVTDFLARPWDYEENFVVCDMCNSVHFGVVACCQRQSGETPIHKPIVKPLASLRVAS
jgi:hypothetical protein